jgi:hypothetical protein
VSDSELLNIRAWDGRAPIILTVRTEPTVQQNYPRAHHVSLPEIGLYALIDEWGLYLPLFQADVTLWPTSAADEALLSRVALVLDLAGVRTLRWADRSEADPARYAAVETVWRDRAALR